MIDQFPELQLALDALSDGKVETFIERFWEAENKSCDLGDPPRCALNFFDAWLLNGFKFYLEFIGRLRVIDTLRAEGGGAAEIATFERNLATYVHAFKQYCKRLDITLDEALAMWPSQARARIISRLQLVPTLMLEHKLMP